MAQYTAFSKLSSYRVRLLAIGSLSNRKHPGARPQVLGHRFGLFPRSFRVSYILSRCCPVVSPGAPRNRHQDTIDLHPLRGLRSPFPSSRRAALGAAVRQEQRRCPQQHSHEETLAVANYKDLL